MSIEARQGSLMIWNEPSLKAKTVCSLRQRIVAYAIHRILLFQRLERLNASAIAEQVAGSPSVTLPTCIVPHRPW